MHIIAMRKAVLEAYPWVARNLYNAFLESKRRSVDRILDPTFEQGIAHRLMTPEEFFPSGIMTKVVT
jgi:4,5-dihydroxyphthalate decarboxylase